MEIKKLYKYRRPDGGVTVAAQEPEGPWVPMYRVIAAEGKLVTRGDERYPAVDTDSIDGWYEVEDTQQEGELV